MNISKFLAGTSPLARLGMASGLGAIAGGTFGAFSDNTSVLGGALAGATLGAGAYGAYGAGKAYKGLRSAGMGRKDAALGVVSGIGSNMNQMFGSRLTRAINPIVSSLKRTSDMSSLARMEPPPLPLSDLMPKSKMSATAFDRRMNNVVGNNILEDALAVMGGRNPNKSW